MPRRRKQYTLVPKLKPLYEDDSRVGAKMMEKMGWSKGKGLGARENGSRDFVKIRYKNNAQGLGYEQRDDNWTQHEQYFNGLLKTLNGDEITGANNDSKIKEEPSNESEDNMPRIGFGFQDTSGKYPNKSKVDKVVKLKEKISGISLEERSKQSKVRLHYKKFTKGKDLTQYSEKDLANIFGKKEHDDLYQQFNTLNKIENKNKNEGKEEKLGGVQMKNSGVYIVDYFKMKMKALKNRCNDIQNIENNVDDENISEGEQGDGICKKKKKSQDMDIENDQEEVQLNKKRKKSKSGRDQDLDIENTNKMDKKEKSKKFDTIDTVESSQEETKTRKKKDKSKKSSKHDENEQQNEPTEIEEKPKTKKRKNNVFPEENTGITESVETINNVDLTDETQKKKNNKIKETSDETIQIQYNYVQEMETSTKDQIKVTEKMNEMKPKTTKESIESSEEETKVSITSQTKKASCDPAKKTCKSKIKDVSSDTNQQSTNDVNSEELGLDELKRKYNTFNIYPISSFCAEKFRNINLNNFDGSLLPQIEGYGISSDLQLDVKISKLDEERITNLWNGALNKYAFLGKPKKPYQRYVKEVFKARKMKQKGPKLHVKTWKRKNAFQVI